MEDNSSSNIDPLFWLPSDFLDDDDMLIGQDKPAKLPTEFPYDSTELTRHFASENKWGLSGSPQSILSPGLSNGSPNDPSSPTAPFAPKIEQSWNLICAAAGEVNMWKMKNRTANKSRALPLPTRSPPNNITPLPSSNKNTPMKPNNGSMWGQPFGVSAEYARCGRVQNQHFNVNGSVSHLTLLFPGGRSGAAGGGFGLKRKCAGTGVFLPRTCPGPTDSKVEPGCSASFTPPTRSAQALNVNYNNNVMTQAKARPFFTHDAMLMRRNAVLAQQWRNGMNMMGNRAMNCEMLLPEEWSYY